MPIRQLLAILTLTIAVGAPKPATEDGWETLFTEVRKRNESGWYEAAHDLAVRLLAEAEHSGPENFRVVVTLNEIGSIAHRMGNRTEAEESYLRGIKILEEHGGHRVMLSMLLDNLASLYGDLGDRYVQVEQLQRRATDLALAELGPKHPDIGILLSNLAVTRAHRHAYSDAKAFLEEAIRLLERSPTHRRNLACTFSNLAALSYRMGEIETAVSLLTRAIPLHEEVLGPTHPELVRTLLNLGQSYLKLDRVLLAQPPLQRALRIAESRLGPQHPMVAEILYANAAVQRKSGRKKEARRLEKQAQAIASYSDNRVYEGASIHVLDLMEKQ